MLKKKTGWSLKVRVWVESNGIKVLGPGRVELLGHIENQGSITAAAKQMGMSYRRAWSLVKDMNDAAGEPLVELATGGSGGGGASLTARGQKAMARYLRILARLEEATAEFRTFGDSI